MVMTYRAQSTGLSAQSKDTPTVRVRPRSARKKSWLDALAIGFAILLSGCQTAPMLPLAGDPFAPANAPRPAVGDTYIYRLTDGYGNHKPGQVSYRVDRIDADRTVVSVTPDTPRAGIARTEIYRSDGNWLRHPLVNHNDWVDYEFAPAYPAYAFPLEPGKSWSVRVDATNPDRGRRSVRIDGWVMGAERVRVPAGEFDTIKIKRIVYAGDRPETTIFEFDWYAPALGRAVRIASDSAWQESCDFLMCRPSRGEWNVYELVSFPTFTR